ncbi:MAG TPA: hypothetical protein PK843_07805 [bacterium]|nr:hypothetical protein [bacterium]HPN34401.1 hypothetical protein [bacterium]
MTVEHWFWALVTAAVVIWYSTITIFVAIKGIGDIRDMLKKLTRLETEK